MLIFNHDPIQQLSFDLSTKLSSISRHSNKSCSDLSSVGIEKRNNHKSVRDATRFYWKSQSPMYLLRQFLSVFSSFLGTTSPIKTSDKFPEPRARFAEFQIFVFFSPLSSFLNFPTTYSPIATFESFAEQDFVETQSFAIFSPPHWQFALDATESTGYFPIKS